ncbi:peptidase associated domain and porin domain-containing protein [Aquimarina agarilytica]|uniref:TonB-dependent receptor n=1 Tax=Aquimarina agarilytica TaxID=1087449 RepID=UPI0002899E2F|nr:TonB-dependent receptor [Aquimarina agarilytica]
MIKFKYCICIFLQSISFFAQNQELSGRIVAATTQNPIFEAHIFLEGTDYSTLTNLEGRFNLIGKLPLGEQILSIQKKGFLIKRLPIIIELGKSISLANIVLQTDFAHTHQAFASVDLSDVGLSNDQDDIQNQTLLQASRDAFLNSVAFNWNATFFKLRGLGSAYTKVLINGVEMNSLYNNRPNWNNWSGLNDVLKSQEHTTYNSINSYSFGSPLGVTGFNFNASRFAKGKKVSVGGTNRSYQGRLMGTFHSEILSNGWSFSVSASARRAEQGYIKGTTLKTYSVFASVEKQINEKHRISITGIYTPVERGKSSPNTAEVTALKGIRYNSYWGNQNGRIRNSRIKRISEPIITLSHFWKPSERWSIQNNILFQKGEKGNSRLDYTGKTSNEVNGQTFFEGGGQNPDPAYYQILPSYFVRNKGNENFEAAFLADRSFRANGQIDWQFLYNSNRDASKNATYILYEDRSDDTFLAANSIIDYQLSEKLSIQTKTAFRSLKSENFAEVLDLLGGSAYLDIDGFSQGEVAQSDLRNPNRLVQEGDVFNYNYTLNALEANGFLQVNYSHNKWNLNGAISAKAKQYQRNGKFENGYYPGHLSLGQSKKLNFLGYGLKLGIQRQITPKCYSKVSLLLASQPPLLQHSFINPRQNNNTVLGIKNEQLLASDVNLFYQYGAIKSRFSAYWIQQRDMTNRSFFFTDNLAGLGRVENAGFFQEIMTDINKQNIGVEFGAEIALTSTLTLNASLAYGKHSYSNNPNLTITSNTIATPLSAGKTFLKNYHLATGPQQAYGLGFSYRDPTYWWFSTQLNYFSHSYNNVSPFLRTQNFATDVDGQAFSNFNEGRARELLAQEQFPAYFLWNAIGGKSWRLKKNYLGCVLGIQNILNQVFKTGGFEQSRNSNYRTLNEDQNRENPLFGSKYWYGSGTTFYINTYYRF